MARDRRIQYPWALDTGQPSQWAGHIESQEVKKSVLITHLLLSGVRNPTSAERKEGDYRYLAWFFPCNAHSVNVNISHSIGGHDAPVQPPFRRLCATLDIWPNATSFSHWPDAEAITLTCIRNKVQIRPWLWKPCYTLCRMYVFHLNRRNMDWTHAKRRVSSLINRPKGLCTANETEWRLPT